MHKITAGLAVALLLGSAAHADDLPAPSTPGRSISTYLAAFYSPDAEPFRVEVAEVPAGEARAYVAAHVKEDDTVVENCAMLPDQGGGFRHPRTVAERMAADCYVYGYTNGMERKWEPLDSLLEKAAAVVRKGTDHLKRRPPGRRKGRR